MWNNKSVFEVEDFVEMRILLKCYSKRMQSIYVDSKLIRFFLKVEKSVILSLVDKFRSTIMELEKIVELMPTKGNSMKDCQKINILHHINELDHCINDRELEDFPPNEYSQQFKLSYS